MNNIRFDIRLRPIRFGFLVNPDDSEKALEIFRINTCLWGGMFNPIIPIFEDVPPWLEDEGFYFDDSKHFINSYLDFFEPDFLVEADEGLADGFGFDPERVLQLKHILEEPGGNNAKRYGLGAYGIYRDLYANIFQFEQRYRHNIVIVKPSDSAFTHFAAANFGSFPVEEQFKYFENYYTDIFRPKRIVFDSAALSNLYNPNSNYSSPLTIGCQRIHVEYNGPMLPTLFILDAHEAKDVVDFWNLRAIHKHVVAIPIQWIEELVPFCKHFIRENCCRLPEDPSPNIVGPVLMFSQSLSEANIGEIFDKYPLTEEEDICSVRKWGPIIWYKYSWRHTFPDNRNIGINENTPEYRSFMYRASSKFPSPTRPTLVTDRKIMNIQVDSENPEIRFDTMIPEFANVYYNLYRVANVVRLQDWSNAPQYVRLRYRSEHDQIATVFPCNYKNPSVPKFQSNAEHGWEFLLPTTEGFVIFPSDAQMYEQWDFMDGTTAFNQWFNDNQIPATRSDGGKTTEQIIQTLESLKQGVSYLANEDIIKLLNEMANSATKTAHYKEFENKINNAITYEKLKKQTFDKLVKHGAVELGYELKCSKCNSKNWYSVKELDYVLTCDLCQKQFNFPITTPLGEHSRWTYRVVGPFALPNYASGGYAASLAIRFFADVIGGFDKAEITWSTGQELDLPSSEKVESDFMLWYRRKEIWPVERTFFASGLPNFGIEKPTETLFGEAKSFGKPGEEVFKQDDIEKMKLLAEAFPCSIFVFATMRDAADLTKGEIERIRKLAEWGREYDGERKQTRAPVIVLTGTELFTIGSLSSSWKEKGGQHEKLSERVSLGIPNLRILADITQYLYLRMSPHGSIVRELTE